MLDWQAYEYSAEILFKRFEKNEQYFDVVSKEWYRNVNLSTFLQKLKTLANNIVFSLYFILFLFYLVLRILKTYSY